MVTSRAIMVVLAIAVLWLPCPAEQKQHKQEKDIWTEQGPHGPRMGPRPAPGPRRFELTDEEINRILNSLKEKEPGKAKELQKLRKEQPDKFIFELRKYSRGEFGKIIRERIEAWRQKRRAEFLQWLEKNYREKAEELTKLKEKGPVVYNEKFDLVWKRYGPIYLAEKRSPELAEVLKADLELREKRDELVRTIKATKSEKEKTKLFAQLQEVVSRRFDLIIRRKEIAYERLLKRIEELKRELKESRDNIGRWKAPDFKEGKVKERVKDLMEGTPRFQWD